MDFLFFINPCVALVETENICLWQDTDKFLNIYLIKSYIYSMNFKTVPIEEFGHVSRLAENYL